MQSEQLSFIPDDLDLLVKVIRLVPELEVLAYAVKMARSRLSFPIVDHEGLLPLFLAENQVVKTDQRQFTFKSTQKFFPRTFFPIVSEDDFLTKAYLAIWNGQLSHSKIQALPVKYIMDKMEIPEGTVFIHSVFSASQSEADQ
jgi:hypothetical protein